MRLPGFCPGSAAEASGDDLFYSETGDVAATPRRRWENATLVPLVAFLPRMNWEIRAGAPRHRIVPVQSACTLNWKVEAGRPAALTRFCPGFGNGCQA